MTFSTAVSLRRKDCPKIWYAVRHMQDNTDRLAQNDIGDKPISSWWSSLTCWVSSFQGEGKQSYACCLLFVALFIIDCSMLALLLQLGLFAYALVTPFPSLFYWQVDFHSVFSMTLCWVTTRGLLIYLSVSQVRRINTRQVQLLSTYLSFLCNLCFSNGHQGIGLQPQAPSSAFPLMMFLLAIYQSLTFHSSSLLSYIIIIQTPFLAFSRTTFFPCRRPSSTQKQCWWLSTSISCQSGSTAGFCHWKPNMGLNCWDSTQAGCVWFPFSVCIFLHWCTTIRSGDSRWPTLISKANHHTFWSQSRHKDSVWTSGLLSSKESLPKKN